MVERVAACVYVIVLARTFMSVLMLAIECVGVSVSISVCSGVCGRDWLFFFAEVTVMTRVIVRACVCVCVCVCVCCRA